MEINFEVARLAESLSRRHTRHGENFSPGTLTPSSASATHSDETSATPANPMRQNAGRILAIVGFKRLISVIKYQELTPDPSDRYKVPVSKKLK